MELLVAKGAYVEQSGRYSNLGTALHMAAGAGHLKILQALVGRFSAVTNCCIYSYTRMGKVTYVCMYVFIECRREGRER